MPQVKLPYNWSPRDYQGSAWDALGQYSRLALCWHRRSGKDEVMLHHNMCAAMERKGNYWYMLPEYAQCRKAIWEAVNPHTGKKRIDEAFPEFTRANTLQQEMKIVFKNGSTWQLMGSDNYDSLVGSSPVGLTFSEYALANPSSWGYLSPIVLENHGWAIFNSTPRGKNHFYKMINRAVDDPEWFSQTLTVNDTHVFTDKEMMGELLRLQDEHDETYGKALWLQEYYCSFDAAMPGSIWGESLVKLKVEGRFTTVEYKPGYPVHSAWDLGHDDDLAIWFFQMVGEDVRVIDYYANNFKDVPFYACELKNRAKNWTLGTHFLPHDAKPKTLAGGGRSILQQFFDQKEHYKKVDEVDIGDFSIVPDLSVEDGIQAARATFRRTYFDKTTCAVGFEHLMSYCRKYDEVEKTFSKTPKHDSHSHASDAFRYLSLVWKKAKETQHVQSVESQLLSNNITQASFGQLREAHFAKMRRQRAGY